MHRAKSQKFLTELENIKTNRTKLKNTVTESKNTPKGINSKLNDTEEWISDLEDRVVEITATEQKKEKRMIRNEDSLRDLWDNIKCTDICILGTPVGEEREKGLEKIYEEIIAENFPNLGKETVTQVQEASTESPVQD